MSELSVGHVRRNVRYVIDLRSVRSLFGEMSRNSIELEL